MRMKYDQDADILILILCDEPPVDAVEEPGGIIVSYGEDGEPVTVEFLNASARRIISSDEISITLQTKSAIAV